MSLKSPPSEFVLDRQGALARFGGDEQLFKDIIGFFLEDSPPLMHQVKQAASAADASGLQHSAHALKGLAAGCGGVRAAQAAQRVEHAGAENDLESIDAHVEALEAELELLRQAATAYRA